MNFPEGFGGSMPMKHRRFLRLTEAERFRATALGPCVAPKPLTAPEFAPIALEAAASIKVHNRL